MNEILNEQHEGAVAFEYIIILIILVVMIYIGFNMMSSQLNHKSDNIGRFIADNASHPVWPG